MTDGILKIFQGNKELLKKIDRAIVFFREEEYESALSIVADMMDEIRSMTDAVIQDRKYFRLVSTDSVVEMLTGIVNAKKNADYILLADLLELQMVSFICGVQELIIGKEDFCVYDEQADRDNRYEVKAKLQNVRGLEEILGDASGYVQDVAEYLDSGLSPEQLLEQGYRVEFTTCGEMTVGAPNLSGNTIYLHTNHRIAQEAMLLAKKWRQSGKTRYVVYGFGMGYVVRELLSILPDGAVVEAYESDINLLKLACAFSDIGVWVKDERLRLIYDPECNFISRRLQQFNAEDLVCVYYPSLCCLKDEESREMLLDFLPWARRIEQC